MGQDSVTFYDDTGTAHQGVIIVFSATRKVKTIQVPADLEEKVINRVLPAKVQYSREVVNGITHLHLLPERHAVDIRRLLANQRKYTIRVPCVANESYIVIARTAEEAYEKWRTSDDDSEYDGLEAIGGSVLPSISIFDEHDNEVNFTKDTNEMNTAKVMLVLKDDAMNVGVRTAVQTVLELIKPAFKEVISKEFGARYARYVDTKWGEGVLSMVMSLCVMTPGLVFDLDDSKAAAIAEAFATEFRRHGMTQVVAPLTVRLIEPLRAAMLTAMRSNKVRIEATTATASEASEAVAKKRGDEARA